MAQPLRIENPERVYFITTRTRASRLWFVHNPKLEERVLSYLARYQSTYEVTLYSFIMMGNHYHMIAKFPRCNKASFMRAFNSIFAKLTETFVPSYDGGRLWARRYAEQVLPNPEDLTHWFYYCALNPVLSGLVSHPSHYPGYSSFTDAANQRERTFTVFERNAYNEAIGRGMRVNRVDYIKSYNLRFSKLPEFAVLEARAYLSRLTTLLAERCKETLIERKVQKKPFPTGQALRVKPGALPQKTKKSHRYSFRPLVLSLCQEAKLQFLEIYFALREVFLEASKRYRAGEFSVPFPQGMYRPCVWVT